MFIRTYVCILSLVYLCVCLEHGPVWTVTFAGALCVLEECTSHLFYGGWDRNALYSVNILYGGGLRVASPFSEHAGSFQLSSSGKSVHCSRVEETAAFEVSPLSLQNRWWVLCSSILPNHYFMVYFISCCTILRWSYIFIRIHLAWITWIIFYFYFFLVFIDLSLQSEE